MKLFFFAQGENLMKRAILALFALAMLSAAPAVGAEKHPGSRNRPKFVGLCNASGDSVRKWIVGMYPGFDGNLVEAYKVRNEICKPLEKFNRRFRPKPKKFEGFCSVAGEDLEEAFFILFPEFKGYSVSVDKVQKAICESMINLRERLRKKE